MFFYHIPHSHPPKIIILISPKGFSLNGKPNVLNKIIEKNSNFTLYAYAYRKLTYAEKQQAQLQWLRASRLKDFPKNGRGEIHSTHQECF